MSDTSLAEVENLRLQLERANEALSRAIQERQEALNQAKSANEGRLRVLMEANHVTNSLTQIQLSHAEAASHHHESLKTEKERSESLAMRLREAETKLKSISESKLDGGHKEAPSLEWQELRASLEAAQAQAAAQHQKELHEAALAARELTIKEARPEMIELRTKLMEAEQQLSESKAKLESRDAESLSLAVSTAAQAEEVKEAKEENQRLKSELEVRGKELESCQVTIKELEGLVLKSKEQSNDLAGQKNIQDDVVATMEKYMNEERKAREAVESELSGLQREFDEMVKKLRISEKDKRRIEAELQRVTSELTGEKALRAQLEHKILNPSPSAPRVVSLSGGATHTSHMGYRTSNDGRQGLDTSYADIHASHSSIKDRASGERTSEGWHRASRQDTINSFESKAQEQQRMWEQQKTYASKLDKDGTRVSVGGGAKRLSFAGGASKMILSPTRTTPTTLPPLESGSPRN